MRRCAAADPGSWPKQARRFIAAFLVVLTLAGPAWPQATTAPAGLRHDPGAPGASAAQAGPVDPTVGDPTAGLLTIPLPAAGPGAVTHAIVVVPRSYQLKPAAPIARTPTTQPEPKRYPVVYLLHGYNADYRRWYVQARDAGRPLSMFADRYDVILVAPDGKPASWYLDAPPDSVEPASWQVETAITKHVIPAVDQQFRTWAEPAGRAITGMSMGGHGAIYLTVRHPELFGACSSMSGIMDLTHSLNKQDLAQRLGSLESNRERWIAASALTLADRLAGRNIGLMLDCGWDDPFFAENRAMHEKLMALKVAHDSVERPGGHDWAYWLNALPYHMQFLSDRLKPAAVAPPKATLPKFRPSIIDRDVPDEQWDMEIADFNRDGRPDVGVARSGSIIWYENPSWKRHVAEDTTKRNVSLAGYDADNDGLIDLAIVAEWKPDNTRVDGEVWWAKGTIGDQRWPTGFVAREPNAYRVRWADVDGDGRKELILAPQKGIGTTPPAFAESGIRLQLYRVPRNPVKDHWQTELIDNTLHMCTDIVPVHFDQDRAEEFLTASFEGVNVFKPLRGKAWNKRLLAEGDQKSAPNRGVGVVAMGRLRGGPRFLATVEPFHGHTVVVYIEPADPQRAWARTVIDEALGEGTSVACGDLDADGNDEIVAGARGPTGTRGVGLRMYHAADPSGTRWAGETLDQTDIAVECLRIADMTGDGRLDVVAVGQGTHNVKLYTNAGKK